MRFVPALRIRLSAQGHQDHPAGCGLETGGPAEKAGIVLGDVIVELEGRSVPHTYEIRSALASSKVGDILRLKLLRGGTPVDVSVNLAERPAR